MEALETFNKLSDEEKIKFFQTLCGNTNGDVSVIGDVSSHAKSPEKPNLSSLFAHLISTPKPASGESSVNSNCGLSDQKKKQKTLDSWVIKSPSKKNAETSPSQKTQSADRTLETSVNTSPVNSSDSRPLITPTDSETTSCSRSQSRDNHSPSKLAKFSSVESGKGNDSQSVLSTNCNGIQSPHSDPKKYTLRSKRKRTSLSPVTGDEQPTKYLKRKSHNDACDESSCLNKPNDDSIQSLSTEDSPVPQCALSKDPKKSIDKGNSDFSLDNKTPSKINVKKKNLKPQTSVDDIAPVSGYTSHSTTTIGLNTLTNNETASKSTPEKTSGDKRKLTSTDNLNTLDDRTASKLKRKAFSSQALVSSDCSDTNRSSSKKNQNVLPTNSHQSTISSQRNYEAFYRLHMECSRIGLNIVDILKNEKVQNLLEGPQKLSNEAMIFLESVKSTSEEKLPVVHVLDSKNRLFEMLTFDLNNSDLK